MKKILVVDDQSRLRELVSVTLEGVGDYKVFEADSGEQGVSTAIEIIPDLILMDVMMGAGLDGLDATRKLRENPTTKDCPIILLTAKGQDEDREKGFAAGANDYFIKPFKPTSLIRRVEEIFEA